MESLNVTPVTHLVSRAIALALAGLAATVVSVGSAAVVTRGANHEARPVHQSAVAIATKEIRFG
jgi:hypothetical protein